jgi:hypothetical protein
MVAEWLSIACGRSDFTAGSTTAISAFTWPAASSLFGWTGAWSAGRAYVGRALVLGADAAWSGTVNLGWQAVVGLEGIEAQK